MNNQSTQIFPAGGVKIPSNQPPAAVNLRKPVVGEPPLIQASPDWVVKPSPNFLSKNAYNISSPNAILITPRI